MDDNTTMDDRPMHPDNGKLEMFTNPLSPSQPRTCIYTISTYYYLNYYFTYKCGCRNENLKNDGKDMKFNTTNKMHHYLYTIHDVKNTKTKVPLFVPTFAKCF